MRQLLCSVRGGHRWKTTSDAAGSITSCTRCGALRHGRTEPVKDGSFKAHVDVAADFLHLPLKRHSLRLAHATHLAPQNGCAGPPA